MKNYTNIYDIDGNIIRKAGDNHKFTVEEIEKLVDDLTEKVKNNPDNEVYKVYLSNATKWLYNMYNNMKQEDVLSRLSMINNQIDEAKKELNEAESAQLDEISKAVEELKEKYNEEYVDFEEITEDERH